MINVSLFLMARLEVSTIGFKPAILSSVTVIANVLGKNVYPDQSPLSVVLI